MIVDLTWERAAYVAVFMRDSDRDEIMSNRWDDDPYSFAAEVMRTPGVKVACIDDNGIPVAMGGISSHVPGVGQAWLVGTDAIKPFNQEISEKCKELMAGLLRDGSIHRVQVFSAASHTKAHRWIKALGLTEESRMKCYGKSKEEFLTFSVVKE